MTNSEIVTPDPIFVQEFQADSIRPGGRNSSEELRVLATIATRSFWNDPLSNHFFPDLLDQHERSPAYFGTLLDRAVRNAGIVSVAYDATTEFPVGFSIWYPPGIDPVGGRLETLRQYVEDALVLATSSDKFDAIRLMNDKKELHPATDHWYLELLATDPKFQRRGVGQRLIQPQLQQADLNGVIAYLETQTASNVEYYVKHGFEVADGPLDVDQAGTVNFWTMIKLPLATTQT